MDIENLNFKLIVDDADFNNAIKAATKAAQDLNTNVSSLLNFQKKMGSAVDSSAKSRIDEAKAIAAEEKAIQSMAREQEKTLQATEKTKQAQEKTSQEVQRTAKAQNEAAVAAQKAAAAQQKVATETARTQGILAQNVNRQNEAKLRQLILEERLRRLQEHGANATRQNTTELNKQVDAAKKLESAFKAAFSYNTVKKFISSLVTVTGEFEKQQIALRTIVNDARGADRLFSQLKALSVESPLTMLDLTGYAKQLSAFSVPLEEIYDTTKRLADVSVGLGVDMNRIILAYGQVRAASFLRGQEVRQFTEAGIPILEELAKQFGVLEKRAVSTQEVFDKISKRQVPFEMVKKAFEDMTNEGGKFYNMQSVLADTLTGKLGKIRDQVQIVLSEIGGANSGILNNTLDLILKILRAYQTTGRVLVTLISTWATYVVTMKGVNAISILNNKIFKEQVLLLRTTGDRVGKTAAAWSLFSKTLKSVNWWAVAISAGVGLLSNLFIKLGSAQKEVALSEQELNDKHDKEVETLKKLKDEIDAVKEGKKETVEGISEYNRVFGEYMNKLISERDTVDSLSNSYNELSRKVKLSYAERIASLIEAKPDENKNNARSILERFVLDNAKDKDNMVDIADRLQDIAHSSDMTAKEIYQHLASAVGANNSYEFGRGGNKLSADLAKIVEDYVKARDEYLEAHKRANDILTDAKSGGAAPKADDLLDLEGTINQIKTLETEYNNWIRLRKEGISGDSETNKTLYRKIFGEEWTGSALYLAEVESQAKETKKELDAAAKSYKLMTGKDYDVLGASTAEQKKQKEEERKRKAQEAWQRKQEKKQRDAISALEKEAASVKRVYDSYKRLSDMSLKGIDVTDLLKGMGYDTSVINGGFEKRVLEIADAIEKIGTEDAKNRAQALRDSVAKDKAEEWMKSYNAFKTYQEAIEQWAANDFDIDGKDYALKVSKILADMKSKNNKVRIKTEDLQAEFEKLDIENINPKVKEAIIARYGQEFWDKYVTTGKVAIQELADAEVEANRKTAQQKINDLANAYANDMLKKLDLSNWTDKSIGQINDIIVKIREYKGSTIDLTDTQKQALEEAGLTLEDFNKAWRAILDAKAADAIQEKGKAVVKILKDFQQPIAEIGKTLTNLGKTDGNFFLSNIGGGVQAVGQMVPMLSQVAGIFTTVQENIKGGSENIFEGVNWDALKAEAAQLGLSLFNGFLEDVLNAKKEMVELEKATRSYHHELELLKYTLDDSYKTIFGDNVMQHGMDVYATLSRSLSDYNKQQDDAIAFAKEYNKELYKNYKNGTLAEVAYLRSAKGAQSLADVQVQLTERSWVGRNVFNRSNKFKSLAELAPEIFNEDGTLVVDKAKAFLDAYSSVWSKGSNGLIKEQLEYLIEYQEKVDELKEEWKSFMTDLFGNLSSDITSKMIDNFKEVGDAVYDLEEPFQSLGNTILQSLLNSLVIDKVLDKYQDSINTLFEQYSMGETTREQLVDSLGKLTGDMKAEVTNLGDFWNDIISQFYKNGLLAMGEESSGSTTESLSQGVKSITENTASLLASYVNAIRADVSTMRMIQTEALKGLADSFSQSPTLNDYLQQIQANTYNNSQYTQGILARLDSVMGAHDAGGSGIKVIS